MSACDTRPLLAGIGDMAAGVGRAQCRLRRSRGVTGERCRLELVAALQATGEEFAGLWAQHEVAVRRGERKRICHPTVGVLELTCEVLLTEGRDQRLLVFSADPGSEAAGQLELLRVVGVQVF